MKVIELLKVNDDELGETDAWYQKFAWGLLPLLFSFNTFLVPEE